MNRKRKQNYRIQHAGHTVEGLASSPQNAARLAFRTLIKAGLIKNTPPTDDTSPNYFKDTVVEVLNDKPV